MDHVVMDASAILALLNQEPGHEMVQKHLSKSVVSSVNASEVIVVLNDAGFDIDEAREMLSAIVKEVVPFDRAQAMIAASLRQSTKKSGLSFGDRACLALAKHLHLTVLTADKSWAKLNSDISIRLIR